MRGTVAKRLRREAYGDYSLRGGSYETGGMFALKRIVRFFRGKGKDDEVRTSNLRLFAPRAGGGVLADERRRRYQQLKREYKRRGRG